jgi:hypothetical protein
VLYRRSRLVSCCVTPAGFPCACPSSVLSNRHGARKHTRSFFMFTLKMFWFCLFPHIKLPTVNSIPSRIWSKNAQEICNWHNKLVFQNFTVPSYTCRIQLCSWFATQMDPKTHKRPYVSHYEFPLSNKSIHIDFLTVAKFHWISFSFFPFFLFLSVN